VEIKVRRAETWGRRGNRGTVVASGKYVFLVFWWNDSHRTFMLELASATQVVTSYITIARRISG
jgi:hypothetical protein